MAKCIKVEDDLLVHLGHQSLHTLMGLRNLMTKEYVAGIQTLGLMVYSQLWLMEVLKRMFLSNIALAHSELTNEHSKMSSMEFLPRFHFKC